MDALWPNLSKKAASNNLRGALYAARKALDPAGDPIWGIPSGGSHLGDPIYLASEGGSLLLSRGGSPWVDVDAYEEAATAARLARIPSAYEAAIGLYTGELLPRDRGEAWTEDRREVLRRMHLSLLFELAGLYEEREESGQAIETLGRAVEGEPANEEAHGALMRL
jgi:DNA-binding SARP family transcriptional activator